MLPWSDSVLSLASPQKAMPAISPQRPAPMAKILRGSPPPQGVYVPPFARAVVSTPLQPVTPQWIFPKRLSYDTRKVQDALVIRRKRLETLTIGSARTVAIGCVA